MAKYQSFEPCTRCQEEYLDRCYHHVKTRKSGGQDVPHNLMSLCLECHNYIHNTGTWSAANDYPQIRRWLLDRGWEECTISRRWYGPQGEAAA